MYSLHTKHIQKPRAVPPVTLRDRNVRGLLRRRTVSPVVEIYIGKESNRLEEAEVGLIHNLAKVLDAYAEARGGTWERLVRPVLQQIPASWLAERTGLSRRTIQRLRVVQPARLLLIGTGALPPRAATF
jgi:hypothetical protein